MSYDAFIAALHNPTVDCGKLRVIFLTAVVAEQQRIIEALPSIVMDCLERSDSAGLLKVLRAFLPNARRLNSAYSDNELTAYWKECAIANLLHNPLARLSEHSVEMFIYRSAFDPVKSRADYTLLFQTFEKIIEQILKKYPVDLKQIKNEYGTPLLTAVIRRYPGLFNLMFELGARVDTGRSVSARERACVYLGSIWMERFGEPVEAIIYKRRYSSPYPSSMTINENNELPFFTRPSVLRSGDLPVGVNVAALSPLIACIIEMSCDPSNELLCEIFGILFNQNDSDFGFLRDASFSIASYLHILEEVKQAAILPRIRSLEEEFVNFTLNDENEKMSLSPYAYGLSRQEVPGDGDCLYHAIALHTDTTAHDLRHAAAAYIEAGHLNDYLAQGHTPQSYAALVRAGAWGDHVEITALMRVLGRPIVVLHEDGTPPTMPEQRTNFPGAPIFISYNGVNHYTGLQPSRGYVAQDILSQMFPLVQRFRCLPNDMKKEVFGFFSPSERISIVRNTQFDRECQTLEESILNLSKKRKKPDIQTDLDADDVQGILDALKDDDFNILMLFREGLKDDDFDNMGSSFEKN